VLLYYAVRRNEVNRKSEFFLVNNLQSIGLSLHPLNYATVVVVVVWSFIHGA